MNKVLLLPVLALAAGFPVAGFGVAPPWEPVEIGHEAQFVFDLQVVDLTWGLKPKGEPVKRVMHPCVKHADNPLITGDDPSHLWVRHEAGGKFQMWYQANVKRTGGAARYDISVAYAESKDGVHWEKPALDLFPGSAEHQLPRNAVIFHPEAPQCGAGAPQILEVPEKDRHGHRYVMLYLGSKNPLNGMRLIGSPDGIHWDLKSDTQISKVPSDTHNTIVYDPAREEYALYCRSKHIYHATGQTKDPLSGGESRRGMSRMTSKELWTEWKTNPQTILMPDERDAELGYNYFMAMPVQRSAGVWWGMLAPFLWNDLYASEIAWSRDGIQFERMPARQHLIEFGPKGAWDMSMICASPQWVEVGDEWWIYYAGFNGPHDDPAARTGAVGLAKIRKEGFVSQHAPKSGGVVCTRALRWPGGNLLVNADAQSGEMKVRVSDELRRPVKGMDYEDGSAFSGNEVAHEVKWGARSLEEMKGKVVRLEFLLKDADLYAFRAGGG